MPGDRARGKQPSPTLPGLPCWSGKLGLCRNGVKGWFDSIYWLGPKENPGHSLEEDWGEDEAVLGAGKKS